MIFHDLHGFINDFSFINKKKYSAQLNYRFLYLFLKVTLVSL